MGPEVIRLTNFVKPIELGDLIGLDMDLENKIATFINWPADHTLPSHAECNFGRALAAHNAKAKQDGATLSGFLAIVVKNPGVTVDLKLSS